MLYPAELRDQNVSGWQDSNLRPPRPKRGAITGLRYTPKNDCKYKVIIIVSKSIINKTVVNYFGGITLTSLNSICPLITLEIVDFNALIIGSFN